MSVGQPSAGIKDGLDFDGIESLRVPAVQTVKMPSSMERQSQDCTRGVGPMYNDLIDGEVARRVRTAGLAGFLL
ncbi:hypothetical protein X742_22925 [Mesorhizobium sp. LNHC232B00]|nr:hypothetical protein X742_22925 [Mesorhizobium sp. LNHC232B00]